MGPDWLKDRFNLDWNDIRNIVINACERSGWQHADDVCGEVMFRLHRQYRNDPTCFENSQHLLGTARAMQGSAYCTPSGKCGDWSFMTPGNCQNLWRGRARMTSMLEKIGNGCSRCSRIASRPSRCSQPRALSFAKFSVSTARG